jgi:uncharacterized membrane protein required for colicin V production
MILDIVFCIVLLTGLLRGVRRGFAGQVIHVGGVVLGVMFAGALARYGGPHLESHLTRVPEAIRPSVLHVGAFLAILLAVWIVGGISLARYRIKTYGSSAASGQDRLLGAVLGALTSAVVACLVVYGIERLPKPIREAELVKVQMRQSLAVQWSRKVPVAAWIANVDEVEDLFVNVQKIADHFRPSDEDAVESFQKAAEDALRFD